MRIGDAQRVPCSLLGVPHRNLRSLQLLVFQLPLWFPVALAVSCSPLFQFSCGLLQSLTIALQYMWIGIPNGPSQPSWDPLWALEVITASCSLFQPLIVFSVHYGALVVTSLWFLAVSSQYFVVSCSSLRSMVVPCSLMWPLWSPSWSLAVSCRFCSLLLCLIHVVPQGLNCICIDYWPCSVLSRQLLYVIRRYFCSNHFKLAHTPSHCIAYGDVYIWFML